MFWKHLPQLWHLNVAAIGNDGHRFTALVFFWKHIFSHLEKRMENYSLKSSSKYSKQFPHFLLIQEMYKWFYESFYPNSPAESSEACRNSTFFKVLGHFLQICNRYFLFPKTEVQPYRPSFVRNTLVMCIRWAQKSYCFGLLKVFFIFVRLWKIPLSYLWVFQSVFHRIY